jgi:outer membrane protein insertion porin family
MRGFLLMRGVLLALAMGLAAAPAAAAAVPFPCPPDSAVAGGAPVVGLDFAGARARSALALEQVVREGFGRPWDGRSLERVLAAVLAAYREIGHLHAAVRAVEIVPGGGGVRLRLVIDEGRPVILGRVDIVGNDSHDDAEIRDLLGLRPGRPFDPGAFASGIEVLLDRYENEGRPFASVEPRDLAWGDEVRFTLAVHEGPPVQVDGIRVAGTRVTRPAVVRRIAGLRPGEPFAETRLAEAEARLRRSGLFAGVEPIELAQGVDRTTHELLIRVREGRSSSVSGAIGYGGRRQGLTGLFDLGLSNLAGTGRRLAARWEGRGQGVALYHLRYSEPWILGSPVTGHAGLARTIQDTLYTRSAVSAAGEVELGPDLSFTAGFERESTVQSAGSVRGTARHALVAGAGWDTRDSRTNPTRGLRLAGEVKLARKTLRYREDLAEARVGATLVSGELERAQLLGRHWVTLARARGAGIRSDESPVPFYELYPLGGAASLRGYREEQFRGSTVFLVQLEARYLLGPDGTRLVGFIDLGRVTTAGTVLAAPGEPGSLVRAGYGAGLHVATRLGIVGLDYGLGEGDGPLDGKLHFALEAAF